jgi:hypothetical protein
MQILPIKPPIDPDMPRILPVEPFNAEATAPAKLTQVPLPNHENHVTAVLRSAGNSVTAAIQNLHPICGTPLPGGGNQLPVEPVTTSISNARNAVTLLDQLLASPAPLNPDTVNFTQSARTNLLDGIALLEHNGFGKISETAQLFGSALNNIDGAIRANDLGPFPVKPVAEGPHDPTMERKVATQYTPPVA